MVTRRTRFFWIGRFAVGPLRRRAEHIDTSRGLRTIGVTGVVFALGSLLAIAIQTDGLINANEGVWVALVAALLVTAGGYLKPEIRVLDPADVALAAWLEIIIIAVVVGGTVTLSRSNMAAWLGGVTMHHRRVFTLATFVVALAFPFAQGGSESNLTIAGNVLIFAATALGLNIVVGLAGLLDLGYIACLGAGAYVGASMSYSAFATIGWKPPFLVVMIIGGIISSILGLIIGSPTLRVSGDYLAIVTLAFGEIFRLAMFNLDGTSGPNLTRGSNGINAIPDLNFFGFDFGQTHQILGVDIPRAGNYYFVLIALIVFVFVVFSNLNNSRIGRGWATELLKYVGLGARAHQLARNMPYGDQRRLEIARAKATDPKVLLLDEPTAGMNPRETEQAMELIFKIRDSGMAVVVIEHDMRFIFNLCDRVLCLVRGQILVEGTPGEVQSDPRVIEAYIGGADGDDEIVPLEVDTAFSSPYDTEEGR